MMPSHINQFQAMISNLEQLQCQGNGTCNFHYSCTFTTNADDTLHYGDMLHSLERLCFAEAMLTEMKGLQNMLEIVLRVQDRAHIKTLPAVCAFK
jgi:hypothetical protein